MLIPLQLKSFSCKCHCRAYFRYRSKYRNRRRRSSSSSSNNDDLATAKSEKDDESEKKSEIKEEERVPVVRRYYGQSRRIGRDSSDSDSVSLRGGSESDDSGVKGYDPVKLNDLY